MLLIWQPTYIFNSQFFFSFKCHKEVIIEASQMSKVELFVTIVNGVQPLTIYAESFILDVCLGSEYTSSMSLISVKSKNFLLREFFCENQWS